jgi:hypothetical protein
LKERISGSNVRLKKDRGRQVFHEIKADPFYVIEEGRGEIGLQQIRKKDKGFGGRFQ